MVNSMAINIQATCSFVVSQLIQGCLWTIYRVAKADIYHWIPAELTTPEMASSPWLLSGEILYQSLNLIAWKLPGPTCIKLIQFDSRMNSVMILNV